VEVNCIYTKCAKHKKARKNTGGGYVGVTINKIAELCGVSRGTVDRVLNNRGNVKKETEEKVLRIAEELNYTPNKTRAMLSGNKNVKIGVVLAAEGNSFFDDILKGMYQAQKELNDYGVSLVVKTMKGYDVEIQLALLDSLCGEVSGIIVSPISDIRLERKINELADKGIPVATVNTDIESSKRLFYVGCNYTKGGEAACGMLALVTGGSAYIGVLFGSDRLMGHSRRISGFKRVCQEKYPDFNVLAYAKTEDDDVQAYEETEKMLRQYPEMNALYIAGAGVYGACRAVLALGREKDFSVICFDRVPGTIEMMKKGLVKATVCQQPYTQGSQSVRMMFNYLASGTKPERVQYILKNEIRIAENI
jgi:LacI family transcriptional regulator